MEPLTLAELATVVGGRLLGAAPAEVAASVSVDSRRIAARGVFFALAGQHTDGHRHLADAFANGAVAAVVGREWLAAAGPSPPSGPLLVVESPLAALQRLAGWWRERLDGRVVAVTGSNGKTIVKDALVHLLAGTFACAGTPGSWNSQLGVPLTLLRLPRPADLAVVEVGVSAPGEMAPLEAIVRPDFGILTNVGLAHIAAFGRRQLIAREKLGLFARVPPAGWVLLPAGGDALAGVEPALACRVLRHGDGDGGLVALERADSRRDGWRLWLRFPSGPVHEVQTGAASREIVADLAAAVAAAHLLGVGEEAILRGLDRYRPAPTRMEIWRPPTRDVTIIDDACSSDPVSVQSALRCLAGVAEPGRRRIFVFGGMRELGERDEAEHAAVGRLAAEHGVDQLVLVGEQGGRARATEIAFLRAGRGGTVTRSADGAQLQRYLQEELRAGDVVLFKAPRDMAMSRAALGVLDAVSPNRLLVDLQAVAENVGVFRRLVGPGRRILAMVKALAYGSDVTRVGVELQRLGVDDLGVATPDEGELLRRAGVDLPILVTLATPESAPVVAAQRLTPVVHSEALVEPLAAAARAHGRRIDVHLEVDTGLGRLGILADQAVALARRVRDTGWLEVVGLMTHFASAETPAQDDYTRGQIAEFERARQALGEAGFGPLLGHAAATAAAVRFPRSRYDMVRIGLGLFGVYPSPAVAAEVELRLAVSLLSRITAIRSLGPGSRLGYGGTFEVRRPDFRLGVLPIGYHDAVPWASSNAGQVLVHGRRAPIVGRVSMDSMLVDLSDVAGAREGMDVLLFGSQDGQVLRPEEVAAASGTMVYELLARIGAGRVQRIFLGA